MLGVPAQAPGSGREAGQAAPVLSGQDVVNPLGDRFAPLRGEELLLLGDIHHHLGDSVQRLFRVREPLAQESIAGTQPHMAGLQRQEGDEGVDQLFFHKAAVAKATV